MKQNHVTVRSIDVGYGNTKFIKEHQWGFAPVCGIFPSIAIVAGAEQDLGAGVAARRDTIVVEVNGGAYEVGNAIGDTNSGVRLLDPSYPKTDYHLALVRCALQYMEVEHVDLLVVGLPVDTYHTYKDGLAGILRGSHPVPETGRPSVVRMVEVKDVRVYPQPLGAFFNFGFANNLLGSMKNTTNLIVDPGFFTLDWLVSKGFAIQNGRCGAYHGGMSSILESIAKPLSAKIGTGIPNHAGIDEGLRNGKFVTQLRGKDCDFSEFVGQAKRLAKQMVHALAARVGNSVDVGNIILTGGGSYFFEEAVKEKFDGHTVLTLPDPLFGNVIGFQLMGVDQEKRKAHAKLSGKCGS
jgi:plasmid segregation protein ParM